MDGHKLYIALRLMNKGSAADVMRYGWPGGMEEDVVRCILQQALQGLNYLHVNGFIHRDVKAANLLIDGRSPTS
jgi:serine/threonine-protein kinase OSR1/STK39